MSANITGNPKFVDPSLGDYDLLATSPAIDAGIQTYQLEDWFDLDDDGFTNDLTPIDYGWGPRLVGNEIDMGAYEYKP